MSTLHDGSTITDAENLRRINLNRGSLYASNGAWGGTLSTVTVTAKRGSDWGLGPELDEISSLIDDLGEMVEPGWQAYQGAMAGAGGVIKDIVAGTASWANNSLWQAGNIVSGGLLARMTSQVEQANYRQSQRTEALLGGLKSLSINGGLTVVDPVGFSSRWDSLHRL